jgi:hypothetical protein
LELGAKVPVRWLMVVSGAVAGGRRRRWWLLGGGEGGRRWTDEEGERLQNTRACVRVCFLSFLQFFFLICFLICIILLCVYIFKKKFFFENSGVTLLVLPLPKTKEKSNKQPTNSFRNQNHLLKLIGFKIAYINN